MCVCVCSWFITTGVIVEVLHIRRSGQLNIMSGPTFHLGMSSTIDEQIETFKDQVVMDSEDRSKIESEIVNDLEPLMLRTFGFCELHVFGSMKSGVAMKGSDLDVCVKVDNCQGYLNSKFLNERRVSESAKVLRTSTKFGRIESRPQAKVPIVSMVHLPTKTTCDVSFNTLLNIEQDYLLQYYLNLHPRFFDVMLVIKFWTKKRGISNGRLYISSYAWNLLYINYLQTLRRSDGTKIVPSVLEMQADSFPSREVQGCRVDFNPAFRHVDLPDDSKFSHLGLLNGFFDYYKNFSFKDHVVCPYLGIPVPLTENDSKFSPQIAEHMANLRFYIQQVWSNSKYELAV